MTGFVELHDFFNDRAFVVNQDEISDVVTMQVGEGLPGGIGAPLVTHLIAKTGKMVLVHESVADVSKLLHAEHITRAQWQAYMDAHRGVRQLLMEDAIAKASQNQEEVGGEEGFA